MQTVEAARDRISAARRSTSIPFAAPTPERLAKAGTSAILGSAVRRIDAGEKGQVDVVDLKTPRWRVQGSFERLAKRGELDEDPMRNADLAAAGERYARDHHQASLDGLRAINLLGGGSNRSSAGLLGSERKCDAFTRYCRASDAMYRKNRLAVDAVVIEGRAPVDVGGELARYVLPKVRSALAMTNLRDGLAELVAFYAAVDALGD